MNLVERVTNLLRHPRQEWTVIARESHTVQGLFTGYVMILAAIPVVAQFVGFSIIGVSGARVPLAYGIAQLVTGYVLSLAIVFVLALAIDALAPVFDGRRDFPQSIKLAAFAPTAVWLAGSFMAIPRISVLWILGLYSLYLLSVGLPVLMRTPEDKTPAYTLAVVVVAVFLWFAAALLAGLAVPGRLRGF